MMAMMFIDGQVAEKEKRVIFARLNELGVTPQEFEQLVKNPPAITMPPTKEDRLRAIFEVCLVMLADVQKSAGVAFHVEDDPMTPVHLH